MTIIEDIKSRIDIVDLVSETNSVRLKRTGANFIGFCPFHTNTHSPALVVFSATGTWKCFGCNEGGTVIDWVLAKNKGWDVTEAINELAEKAGIQRTATTADLPLAARIGLANREDVLRVAFALFKKWLLADVEALAYTSDRGWDDSIIKTGLVGFSGRGTQAQYNEMRGEFSMRGIDPLSPPAVMILGFRGDVEAWAKEHEVEAAGLPETTIHGLMGVPGLVYAHKTDGQIKYVSRRQLPGFDKTKDGSPWKSFNPYAALAGERQPFFNNLHRVHYTEGREKGKRIHIVEGQGDALTWGMFGEPAMALCGSSWNNLEKAGIIDLLKKEYKEICYTADSDKPGETVLTGKNNDYPLSTAFGPMLWVERTPMLEWVRPDGTKKTAKDMNDLAQHIRDSGLTKEASRNLVEAVLSGSEPIVLLAARYAGMLVGQLRETAVETVVRPLLVAMPENRRLNYSEALAEALYPSMAKAARRDLYKKWLTGELKKAAQDSKDEEEDLEIIETLGGWYPEDSSENSGYLIDVYYDTQQKKIRFAYVHITDMKMNLREAPATAGFLVVAGKKYQPPSHDENIETGAVKLATGIGEKKSASWLINHMAAYYKKYFYLEEQSRYRFCASYALFTWVHDSFEALNFLRARGGSGSGKSDLMYLVGLTCYRFAVTLSISSSASYKGIVKVYRATVMIDEADNLMKKDDGTMEAFLKGRSMKRYSNAMNMMEVMGPNGKTYVPTTTNVYGPTLITMYHNFKDPGIENRCVTFDLSQVDTFTLAKEGLEPGYYPPELESDGNEIRNMCLRWRLETWQKKIELSPEQRQENNLVDPLVSPRVNQVLRPMKVLAVLQEDKDLLSELRVTGQANYEDEMIKRAGTFEALILRAILAADIAADVKLGLTPTASTDYAAKVSGYSDKVKIGKLGRHNQCRYILYKDLAEIANQIMDVENTGGTDDRKKDSIKGKTIGDVSRETFRLPVERTGEGWAVVLDKQRMEIAKLRFGLDRESEYKPAPELITPPPAQLMQVEYKW